jgi:hypothetical protein
MTEAVAAPATPKKKRAPRTPSLGVETQSITIDLPKDMYKKFEAAANEELLPLKLFVVRELAGKNKKATEPVAD